jgi:ketosteroid isomerase-like protein
MTATPAVPTASIDRSGNTVGVDRDEVMHWVAKYERAWRDGDLAAVEQLFADDAHYRPSPYDEAKVGHDAIKAFWLDDEDEVFTVHAEPVAIESRHAVVRVEVRYGDPVRQEYRDLWVLRFADDGRVEDFEEWAYWPDKPYSAAAESGA